MCEQIVAWYYWSMYGLLHLIYGQYIDMSHVVLTLWLSVVLLVTVISAGITVTKSATNSQSVNNTELKAILWNHIKNQNV